MVADFCFASAVDFYFPSLIESYCTASHGSLSYPRLILPLFQDTMAAILDHLKHVAMKADVNKMPVQNLAVCFGPVLLCPSISPTAADSDVADDFKKHTEVLAYLLDIWPENRGKREEENGAGGGGV